jgi:putative oxidoreductase
MYTTTQTTHTTLRNDRQFMTLFGRCLLGSIFILSALSKLMDPQAGQNYMAALGLTSGTVFWYWGAVVLELVGGLSVLFGAWTRIGAGMLILFLIPMTFFLHSNVSDPGHFAQLLMNLGIVGGLLYVAVFGAGPISVDSAMVRERQEEEGIWVPGRSIERRRSA